MSLRPRDLAFVIVVLAVVGLLYFLSTKNKAKPLGPNPPEHMRVTSREDCLKCHLPETMADLERQHKHPGKWKDARVNCLMCHTVQKK